MIRPGSLVTIRATMRKARCLQGSPVTGAGMNDQRHYEHAFQAYLRALRVKHNLLRETHRNIDDEWTIKSFDLLINASNGRQLLVDVKGRRLERNHSRLENWVTEDDIQSLGRWQSVFGPEALSLLAFVYHLVGRTSKVEFHDAYTYQDRCYGFLGVPLADYRNCRCIRSPRWETVDLPQEVFRELAKPISHWL